MKIATKSLASLLIVTLLSLSSVNVAALSASDIQKTREGKLERVARRHDRKMELTANVLGVTTTQLKDELKQSTFDQVLKKHGFKTREAFHIALAGKLKDELHKRGWSDEKINKVVQRRLDKVAS